MNGPHFLFDSMHVLAAAVKAAISVQTVDGDAAARLFALHFAQRELDLSQRNGRTA